MSTGPPALDREAFRAQAAAQLAELEKALAAARARGEPVPDIAELMAERLRAALAAFDAGDPNLVIGVITDIPRAE